MSTLTKKLTAWNKLHRWIQFNQILQNKANSDNESCQGLWLLKATKQSYAYWTIIKWLYSVQYNQQIICIYKTHTNIGPTTKCWNKPLACKYTYTYYLN